MPCRTSAAPARVAAPIRDLRWHLLDLARRCRDPLGLRDRDITVLRGLLTLLPASNQPERLIVFASNRVLIDRCDGIDERTLRRRILHLQAKGLLVRKLSPNGKRYLVRDESAEARLTYGIDLSPLFAMQAHLEALAESEKREDLRRSALRAVVRDVLYHHAGSISPELCEQARLSLRRTLTSAQLQDVIDLMRNSLPADDEQGHVESAQMSASHSQNDRHIQSSNKESFDSECKKPQASPLPRQEPARNDITVDECVALAKNAAELAPNRPRTWADVIELSAILAPAIGLTKTAVQSAQMHLGAHGCALAVIGLVEAFDRIRNPRAYFQSLTLRAEAQGLDCIRMFRSLAKPERSAQGLS